MILVDRWMDGLWGPRTRLVGVRPEGGLEGRLLLFYGKGEEKG